MEYIKLGSLLENNTINTVTPSFKLQNSDITDTGAVPVISQEKDFINGYTDVTDKRLARGEFVVFGDHTECLKFVNFAFVQGADGIKILQTDPLKIDTRYLYYALCECYNKTGFYERHFKLLRKTYIPNYDLGYQHKLVSVLSTYDDLIENNNKRIRILENLVKDWYQHNFSTEKIKSCSNLIKLGEVIQIIRGVSYSSEEIDCEDGNDLINLKNIQAFGGFRLDGTKKYNGKYKKEQIVKTGDLIMGVTDMTQDRRTVGSVALIPITQNTSVISADLIKIQSNLDSVFLYAMFRYGNISKYISQFANGANVLHLRPQAILNIKVFLPEEKKIMDFAQKVKPILDEINILNEKNANLAKQRDLLLPRLMSGKLEIKGTDDA